MLAIDLPALAAGAAWGQQQDVECIQQLTLTLASTVGAAELLKRTVKATRPDGSDDKSFSSGHTAVAFAAVRFMDKRYSQQVALYRLWLYAAAGLTGVAQVVTRIELAVNLAQPEWHPVSRDAKDVAAAGVLVCSLGAVAVGRWVLGPKLWAMFSTTA